MSNDDDTFSVDSMFPSKFLRAVDIPARGVTYKIEKVYKDVVSEESGVSKWMLKFVGESRPMTLNVTNGKTLGRLIGPDRRQWVGKKITLHAEDVMGPNGMTLGIRIKAVENGAAQGARPDFGDTVDDIRM